MPWPLVEDADVSARLSPAVVRRLLDDDNDGTADANALERLKLDASARVAGFMRGIYPIDTIKAMAAEDLPEETKRLTLDGVVTYAAQRHPSYVGGDWVELWKAWTAELKEFRAGLTSLDVDGSPEPAANQGTEVSVGDPDTFDEDCFEPDFAWGTSDF